MQPEEVNPLKIQGLDQLKKIRCERKITLQQMGDALGVNRSSYYRMEKGEIELRLHHIPVIAKRLGVPVGSLLKIFFDHDVA